MDNHQLEGDSHDAWLEGFAHGYVKAMDECIKNAKNAKRDGGTVGGRNCMEIREAINKLHFETLCERYPILPNSQVLRHKK